MKKELLKAGYKSAFYVLIATFALSIFKLAAGIISNTLVVVVDGMHSMVDMVVLMVAYIGIRISCKEPDRKFQYGYYKAESIASLFISLFIFIVAFKFMYEGYMALFKEPESKMPYLAIFATLVSIISSYLMSVYLLKAGKKTKMHSLIATSNERKMDMLSSLIVIIAIVLGMYHIRYVEGIITMGIAAIILKTGILSLRDAIASLMDVSPRDAEERVRKILENARIRGYKDLKLRKAGPFIFGEVKILLDASMDIQSAHDIADEIEEKVKKIGNVDGFITHIEPYSGDEVKMAIPVEKRSGDANISRIFGRSRYFMLVYIDTKNKGIKKLFFEDNPHHAKEKHAGLAAASMLAETGVRCVVVNKIGEIAYYALKNKGIRIFEYDGRALEAVDEYMKGKLKVLKEPKKVE